jgi:hypothetical protein
VRQEAIAGISPVSGVVKQTTRPAGSGAGACYLLRGAMLHQLLRLLHSSVKVVSVFAQKVAAGIGCAGKGKEERKQVRQQCR